jgi:hypothetical protein
LINLLWVRLSFSDASKFLYTKQGGIQQYNLHSYTTCIQRTGRQNLHVLYQYKE